MFRERSAIMQGEDLTPEERQKLLRIPHVDQTRDDIDALLDEIVPLTPDQERAFHTIYAAMTTDGVAEADVRDEFARRLLASGDEEVIQDAIFLGAMRAMISDPKIVAYLASTPPEDVTTDALAELFRQRYLRNQGWTP
jgi:hypothetical protein